MMSHLCLAAQWIPTYSLSVSVEGPKGIKLKDVKAFVIMMNDTIKSSSQKDNTFNFTVKSFVKPTLHVHATAEGFEKVVEEITLSDNRTITTKTITLKNREMLLPVVSVKGHAKAMVYKGDTIQFNAAAVNKLQGDMAREVLEQMPGVQIKNEQISVLGKKVESTYVDGKSLFGDNPMTALDHVGAEDLVHIKVYEEGETKRRRHKAWVLNLITKSKMVNSSDGSVIGAAGHTLGNNTLGEHEWREAIGGVFNFFSEELLLTSNLMHNNENIASNSRFRFLNTENRPTDYSENSIAGVNVNRKWNKRKSGLERLDVGYQFTRKATERQSASERHYTPTAAYDWRTYTDNSRNTGQENSHQLSTAIELGLNQLGSLRVSLGHNITHQRENSLQTLGDATNISASNSDNRNRQWRKAHATNLHADYSKTLGRWHFGLSGSYGLNDTDTHGERLQQAQQQGEQLQLLSQLDMPGSNSNYQHGLSGSIRYKLNNNNKAPVAKVTYKYGRTRGHLRQTSWNLLKNKVDSINTYDYLNHTTTHQVGTELYVYMGGWELAPMMEIRRTTILDEERTWGNAPEADYRFTTFNPSISLSNQRGYSISYELRSQLPNVAQLRRQTDNQNPYFLQTGNPSLKVHTTHHFQTMDNIMLDPYGKMIMVTGTVDLHTNAISNRTTYYTEDTWLPELGLSTIANSQVSTFTNLDGGIEAMLLCIYTHPLNKLRSSLEISLTDTYSKLPIYFNDVKEFFRSNHSGIQAKMKINRIPKTRINVNCGAGYTTSSSDLSHMNSRAFNFYAGTTIRTDLPASFFVEVSYDYDLQHRISLQEHNTDHVLNLYLGRHFAKNRGEVSLTAYDLFNTYHHQVTNIKENYTSYAETAYYGRFVSLNLTWTFRKLKTSRFDLGQGTSW